MPPERPPKVFVSYSHDSDEHKDLVLALADRLLDDGLEVILDEFVSPPPANWPRWMEDEMESSDFIVVVCSKNYLDKVRRRVKPGEGKGVKWESLLSYQQIYDNDSNSSKFIPVLLEGGEYDHIPTPMRGGNHYRACDDKDYEKLFRHITNQPENPKRERRPLKKLPPRQRPAIQPRSKSTPWNVPHARNDAFTGREQLLADLRADLLKKGKQALFGLGGVGKTQIAAEYAWRHRDEYTAVLWCFAGTEQSVRGGYAAIAALLDLPEKESQEQAKVTDAVKGWLEQNTGWLLVLDNADDPAMVKPFLPQGNTGHLLLTSRAYSFQKIGLVSPREVNVLSPDEARDFLLRRTGKGPSEKSPEADALAKEVGYLPLALEQAAAYIAETGASFKNYLAGFKTQRLKVLERQGPVMGNDEKEQQKRTVATAWALNFADVEKASPASAELLQLSAFLAPDAIPLELLEKGGAKLPKKLAAKLAEAADNPLALDELLSPLLRFSLIRRDEEKRTYSIHPLVQEVVRDGLSKEDQKAWAERAVRIVNSSFPNPKFENWPICDRLLPHALACSRFINIFSMESAEEGLLLSRAGYYLNQRAEYAQAEPLYQRALAIDERALGAEHPDTAASLNNLAVLYYDQAQYNDAEPLFRRALAIRESVLGPEHPNAATTLNNLAELYRTQGHHQEAEPLYRRALAIREKALGTEHPDTAGSLNSLAVLLDNQGKPAEAEPLYRRSLAIREKALGPSHPMTATSLNNLAELYRRQNRNQEAEPLYRRALEIKEKNLGPEHPSTATGLHNLAGLLVQQGKFEEAEPLYRRALAIHEKALGPEHPNTATSLNNLAGLLSEQGKSVEAEPLFRQALTIREKALGPEHPRTVIVRNNLIQFYRKQGRNAKADALQKVAKGKAK
jgi:tetratricopeptide (TPR) repeat protein